MSSYIKNGLYGIEDAEGLPDRERARIRDLVKIYNFHITGNETKNKYYEGHVSLSDVNLGIALPKNFNKLEIGCEWGAKCVDVLASRSVFDGYVGADGNDAELITRIVDENNLISEYQKACRDELKYGCTFATLAKMGKDGCSIRFHTPETAAAKWDGVNRRIECGFAIIDTVLDALKMAYVPTLVYYYTDDAVWELVRDGSLWMANMHPHKMGRPLMEPLVWGATSGKPFGRSRLKRSTRRLIDGYIRTIANATIALEFATAPQKYILGVTDAQYGQIIGDKFKQYVGSILASTYNPETGEKPTVGQFQQGSLTPHVEMMRILATQFSAATGLTVTDTGVVNDANPTSSDAILAQSQTLVSMAEQLNDSNGHSLQTIAMMAQAIARDITLEELTDKERNVIAHFRNPAMPSLSVTADAAIKVASARQEFASTDIFLEMIGFDQADIRRIRAQEQRARGQQLLLEEFSNDNNGSGVEEVREQAGEGESEGSGTDAGVRGQERPGRS